MLLTRCLLESDAQGRTAGITYNRYSIFLESVDN